MAAFASANLGDVSPNLKGAKCIDTGKDCDLYQSTCEGRTQNCIAFGPGDNMKESTYIIGDRQFQEAKVSNLFPICLGTIQILLETKRVGWLCQMLTFA